ncbi:SpoVG family protein [Ruminococcus albus]|uniref:Stage V sporulation protein G n=1 Tax=Ruminococcus albus TaxID=1264 RepID=A0A1H7MXA3_RUMAL|nr:SpoVG family protein [Ruminococcus albus]SEL15900.1 stage V sporulation protein G [Ruminococcus albus]
MEISGIKIRKITNIGRLRGIVSVTFDDVLAVHDIKVVQGERRLFAAMPSRRDENGIYRDIVHPITATARADIENRILRAFEEECIRRGISIDS